MKKRHNIVKLGCLLAIFCLCLTFDVGSTVTVYAESGINEAEKKLVQLANKTFTYKGKKYKAHQKYKDAAIAYIAQDGVDLTESQVKGIISEIYGSLEKGISRGYLYEVTEEDLEQTGENSGETSTENPSMTQPPTNTETPTNTEKPSVTQNPTSSPVTGGDSSDGDWFEQGEYLEDDFEIPEKTPVSKPTTNPAEIDKIGALTEEQKEEQEEVLNNRPPKDEAGVVVEIDSETGKLVDDEGEEVSLVKGFRNLVSKGMQSAIVITSIVIGAITLLSIGILYITKCFTFQKRGKRGRTIRGKIRNSIRVFFVVSVSMETFVILLLVAAQIALFTDNVLVTTIAESGYYRSSYEAYQEELKALEKEYEMKDSDLVDVVTYEQYLMDMKNKTNQVLAGTQEKQYGDTIKEQVLSLDLDLMEKVMLAEEVGASYDRHIDSHALGYIMELKTEVRDLFTVVLPIMVVSLLLTVPALVCMDSSKRKGLRILAYGVGIGTGILLVIGTLVAVTKPYASVYISPDYLYLLFVNFSRKGCRTLLAMCGMGAVLELVILLLLRRRIKGKPRKINGVK